MEKMYTLQFKIKARVFDAMNDDPEEKDAIKLKAKKFTTHFARDIKAVDAFFQSTCIAVHFHHSQDIIDRLGENCGYIDDIGVFFLNVAKKFPKNVKVEMIDFIKWVYEDLPVDHPEIKKREEVSFYLECVLIRMIIVNARFVDSEDT